MDSSGLDVAAEQRPTWSQSLAQFVRAPLLAVTFIFVLLGMSAAGRPVSVWSHLVILVGALAFHISVYVVNDIVDLPIDRTEPRRWASPLVRGTMSTRLAAAIGAFAAVLALTVAALAQPRAALSMAVAIGLLWLYDAWGKRCPVPPVTDFAQGVGWAALVWYGSDAARHATGATRWLGAYVIVSIMLVNGVHGAVRDLANDEEHGARTTAIWFGARADGSGSWTIPTVMWVYAIALHVVAVGVLVGAIATGGRAGEGLEAGVEVGVVVAVGTACGVALGMGLARSTTAEVSWRAGFAYIIGMLLLPLTVVVHDLRGVTLASVIVLFVAPWANSTYVRSTLGAHRRWGRP